MSDSQAYDEVTVGSSGVTVKKRFEEDEFPVPAIAFEFASEREESVRVRLSDQVPEGVAVEDLGFHPEYGSEYWEINNDTIIFERELGAGSDYTSVYGIRATGTDDIKQFLTEPVIEEVDPPLPGDEIAAETDPGGILSGGDDVVRDVISGEGEIPGLEESDEEGDEEVEKLDLTDPTTSDETVEGTGTTTGGYGGSVIAAMAEEIRSEDVTIDDLKLVQRAIDHVAEDRSDGSTDARVEQLQTDIADLRAYTNAMEEFLDENGTGEQLIEDFESELASFRTRLDEMGSELDSNTDIIENVEGTVDSVSEEMDGVTTNVEDMQSDVERIDAEVESVSSSLDDIETKVSEIDDIEARIDDIEDVGSRLEDLDEVVENIQSTIEDLEEEITDGDVVQRLDTMESDVEELRNWQEQIKQTFGG